MKKQDYFKELLKQLKDDKKYYELEIKNAKQTIKDKVSKRVKIKIYTNELELIKTKIEIINNELRTN